MPIKNKYLFKAIFSFLCILYINLPVWGQTRLADNSEIPAIKIALSDDISIIIERILYEALKRSGYQMVTQRSGMRTSIMDVNNGDAVILPCQTDGFEKMYTNLLKVPVALDNVEFTAYARSKDNYQFSEWKDLAGLKLGYRLQNAYIADNISRARAGSLVAVNEIDELWTSLLDGKTDAILLPRMSHFIYRCPQGIKQSGVIERQPVFNYVNNKHAYLVPLLEKAYKDMHDDGTIASIQNGSTNHEYLSNDSNKNESVILHINSFNTQNEWERSQTESIRSNIEAELFNKQGRSKSDLKNTSFEYYNLYLNSNEYHSKASFYAIISYMIRTEFVMRPPDLVIASGDEAFEFVLNNYFLLFPNVPVLFTNVIKVQDSMIYGLENYVTGIAQTISFGETVSKMLDLFPETKQIYILNDYYLNKSKTITEDLKNSIKTVKQNLNKQVEFIFNENKPLAKIIDDIKNYDSNTLVLIGKYISDGDGVFYSEDEIQSIVSNASRNPVFCLLPSYIGNGSLGGLIPDPDLQSIKTASMAVEILKGAPLSQIPVIYDSSSLNKWQFDYNAIKIFNIRKKNLPKDCFIINSPIPLWESSPDLFMTILVSAALFLIIVSGIVFFLRLMSRKEADDNMHILLDALPMCCQLWNRSLKTIDSNKAAIELFGHKTKYEYFDMFIENCSPEYQPDGQHSEKKAHMYINKAFEEGYCKFEWMHRHVRGDLIPAEVTLIKVKHNKEGDLVACYIRDLKEHKKHINEIEKINDDLNKDEKFKILIQTNFVRNNQTTYENIIKAMQNNDMKLAHRIAHTLKSNAGQIGKSKLQTAAAVLESMLAQEINPLQKEELNILEKELNLVLSELSPLLDEINANKTIKINNAEKIRGILSKLEPMLINKNPECEELLADIYTIPGAEELAHQIDKFNFKQAIEELSKLKNRMEMGA